MYVELVLKLFYIKWLREIRHPKTVFHYPVSLSVWIHIPLWLLTMQGVIENHHSSPPTTRAPRHFR